MRTILPLGVIFALSLAGCSNSPTAPADDSEASMDPGRIRPISSCTDPNGHNGGHRHSMSPLAKPGTLTVWYTSSTVRASACSVDPSVSA